MPGDERSGASTVEETLVTVGGPTAESGSRGHAELAKGSGVGRYVVLQRLGAGGMGVVYAAYDPELDRKVAIKLLREGEGSSSSPPAGLLGEAQALAKLGHPHVVAIHDVGTMDGRVWLAMEFIEGETLGRWLANEPRGWRDVVRVLQAAGEGLAAAHAAGLLHRDFKPDNVMVGRDGRVRVMDFGLARARDRDAGDPHAGALVGTPAYMSPEQLETRAMDARSDQFGFCVTLWEALYRERPFGGETLVELAASVLAGSRRPPPRNASVPGWLRRLCERGLEREPARRFESMPALLAELERGQERARRRWIGTGLAVVAAIGGASWAWTAWDEHTHVAACDAEGEAIAQVWNDDARARVHDGLVATTVSYAPTVADKVMPWLDAHASAWREHRTRACRNARVDESWDARTHAAALWCLDERRLELESLVEELARADGQVVTRAVGAAAGLSDVRPCLDEQVLERSPPPPAGVSGEEIAHVRAALARSGALLEAGRYSEGVDVARSAAAQADALGWAPLVGAARHREGALLVRAGEYADAESASVAAYVDAAKAGAWDVAAASAQQLVYIVGYRQARAADGRMWARHAEIAAFFAGDPLGLREAGRLNNLALVEEEMGDGVAALALYERALALKQAALPADHPDLAISLNNLANVHQSAGDSALAIALHERALAIWETALGPDHPHVAATLVNLSNEQRAIGAHSRAKELAERALGIQERALGQEHPNVAATLNSLGNVHDAMGDHAAAKPLFARAVAIQEKAGGTEHRRLATVLHNLATMHRKLHERDQARATYERALAIKEKALGGTHPDLALTLAGLGKTELESGRAAEARAALERAVAIYAADPGIDVAEADARFWLAEALVLTGGPRDRALAEAEQAIAGYTAAGAAMAEERAEVAAWLERHRSDDR